MRVKTRRQIMGEKCDPVGLVCVGGLLDSARDIARRFA